jgi:rod shape determining protein RodA
MWNRFKTLDPLLFVIPLILLSISVTVIFGLTNYSSGSSLAIRQAVYGGVGFIVMLLLTFLDYRSLRAWAIWLYGIGIIALAAVQLVGVEVYGATRWIDIGFFQFQPGELEKAIIIICLATLLGTTTQFVTMRRFLFALFILLVPALAVLLQPDLGTALVILVTGATIIMHSRLQRSQWIILLSAIAVVVLSITLSFKNVRPFTHLLKDYQKDRLASFVDDSRDKKNTGYNVDQSKIAVGSGGLLGQGFLNNSQSQLHFLPVAHADFIFAGLAESWGLVGAYGIIALYALLIYRIMSAARIAKDRFGMLLCVGIMAKLLFEVLVNIGMNIGIMPVTGIPLPLLSYGGTTLITNALLIGIAQSIVIRYKRLTF